MVQYIKTLSVDNEWKFTENKRIAKELNCCVYFAKPYCSTDKELVDNHNQLIMDFVPKALISPSWQICILRGFRTF
jgi:IS30 family transposase